MTMKLFFGIFVLISVISASSSFLRGKYVEVGFDTESFSLGTKQSCPAEYVSLDQSSSWNGGLGLNANPKKDSWATHSGDYVMYGTAEEGWVLQYNVRGAQKRKVNKGMTDQRTVSSTKYKECSQEFDGSQSDKIQCIQFEGQLTDGDSSLNTKHVHHLVSGDHNLISSIEIFNDGMEDLETVKYLRTINPNQGKCCGGNYRTSNYVSSNPFVIGDPAGRTDVSFDKAAVIATATNDNSLFLGLGSSGKTVRANHFGFVCENPSLIWSNTLWHYFKSDAQRVSDESIHLAFNLGNVNQGEAVRFGHTYGTELSSFDSQLQMADRARIILPIGHVSGKTMIGMSLKLNGESHSFEILHSKNGELPEVLLSTSLCRINPEDCLSVIPPSDSNRLGMALSVDFSSFDMTESHTLLFKNTIGDEIVTETIPLTLVSNEVELSFVSPSASTNEFLIFPQDGGVQVEIQRKDTQETNIAALRLMREHFVDGIVRSEVYDEVYTLPYEFSVKFDDLPVADIVGLKVIAIDEFGDIVGTKSIAGLVSEVPAPPTDIILSETHIAEGMDSESIIGVFTVIDDNTYDSHVLKLLSGTDEFEIVDNNKLKALRTFDFEETESYIIDVQVTDSTDKSITRTFTISIDDVNESPTVVTLSVTSIPEDMGIGSEVGILKTEDPDIGQSHSYRFRRNDGGRFSVVGDRVVLSGTLDYETNAEHTIIISVTDNGSPRQSHDEVITIQVEDVNEAPQAINLGPNNIYENAESGVIVGTMSVEDQDDNQSHTYQMRDNSNGRFKIVGSMIQLVSEGFLDYETEPEIKIKIRATDSGSPSRSTESWLTINVKNSMENASVEDTVLQVLENSPVGTTIGVVRVDNPSQVYMTYEISDWNGCEGLFILHSCSGTIELAQSVMDYEVKSKYEMSMKVLVDPVKMTYETKALVIEVIDVNEAPLLQDTTVEVTENRAKGDVVLETIDYFDPDEMSGDYMTFTITAGNYGNVFAIGDPKTGQIIVDSPLLNFETATQEYQLSINGEDTAGNGDTCVVTVYVLDQNEIPVVKTAMPIILSIDENSDGGLNIGLAVEVTDPDEGDMLSFAIAAGNDDAIFDIETEYGRIITGKDGFESDGAILFNVNADDGVLGLDSEPKAFPFLWVALSNRGTMVKIDSETGDIKGEYWTSPSGIPRNPSRTVVDLNGNVWCGNRNTADGGRGGIIKVGMQEKGQCQDRNGDGVITTSTGLGNKLSWSNSGGKDSSGGVSTAADECIIDWARTIGTPNVRSMAMDGDGNLWIGSLDAARGHPQALVDPVTHKNILYTGIGCGGYGGIVNIDGVYWGSSRGPFRAFRYDPSYTISTAECLPRGRHMAEMYGIGADMYGNIYVSQYAISALAKFDPSGEVFWESRNIDCYCGRGVSFLKDDDPEIEETLYIACTGAHKVQRTNRDGQVLETIVTQSGGGPTASSVDSNGNIWTTNYYGHTAQRIKPDKNGRFKSAVDITVAFGAGAGPYDYSDLTGQVAMTTTKPSGSWTYTYDSGINLAEWGTVRWKAIMPPGCTLTCNVKSGNTLSSIGTATQFEVANGIDFNTPNGRYLQVDLIFTPNKDGSTPSIYQLIINPKPPSKRSAGQIFLAKSNMLDFETASEYSLTLTATDHGSPVNVKEIPITIKINDLNEVPVFDSNSYTFDIDEDVSLGDNVGSPLRDSVTDQDQDDVLTFKIMTMTNSADVYFNLHPSTGQISVANELDYELYPVFTMTIRAMDKGGLYDDAAITINVQNKNESPKITFVSTAFLEENSDIGTSLYAGTFIESTNSAFYNKDQAWTICAIDEDDSTVLTWRLEDHQTEFSLQSDGNSPGCVNLISLKTFNFETITEMMLTISVSDGALSDSVTFKCLIVNVNEKPVLNGDLMLYISSGSTVGYEVGYIPFIDEDIGQSHTYTLDSKDQDPKLFEVTSEGVLRVKTAGLFKDGDEYDMTIQVTDNGIPPLFDSKDIRVTVSDIGAPKCNAASGDVLENSDADFQIIEKLTCDKNELTFSLVGGNFDDVFHIDQFSSEITLKKTGLLDFETNPIRTLTVRAADDSTPPLTTVVRLTINVLDANEKPVISSASYDVDENSKVNKPLGDALKVVDPDADDVITFSIRYGNDDGMFDLDSSTGLFTVAKAEIDFENKSTYTLVVRATDKDGLFTEAGVIINIIDINDVPTVEPTYTFNIPEDTTKDFKIGQINALDQDRFDILEYTIVHANAWSLPEELTDSKTVFIKPTLDIASGAVSAVFMIQGESDAHIFLSATKIADSQTPTYIISLGSDDDGNLMKLRKSKTASPIFEQTYSDLLSGDEARPFWVTINYLEDSVELRCGKGETINEQVLMSITDDEPLIGANKLGFSFTNDVKGEITRVQLSQDSGNVDGLFRIDSDGNVFLNSAGELDYETMNAMSIDIRVQDRSDDEAHAIMEVTLEDVNEAPWFVKDQCPENAAYAACFTVKENLATGSAVGESLHGFDQDGGDVLTYRILSGNVGTVFALSSSGQLTLARNDLDYEDPINGGTFELTCEVADRLGAIGEALVLVTLTDENESPTLPDSVVSIEENSADDSFTSPALVCTDPDFVSTAFGTLRYEIIDGNEDGLWDIDAISGVVKLVSADGIGGLNFEMKTAYEIVVNCYDGGDPALSDSAQIMISIIDVNEQPYFEKESYRFPVEENSARGLEVGSIIVIDEDSASGQTYFFTLTPITEVTATYFRIDDCSGVVNAVEPVDYEKIQELAYELTVTDNGSPQLSSTVDVTFAITNVNESPTVSNSYVDVLENSVSGTVVVNNIPATDPDVGDILTYTIQSGNNEKVFTINDSTGQITFANGIAIDALNYELKDSYDLIVRVTDKDLLHDEAHVYITVRDIAEAPVLEDVSRQVREDADSGTRLGAVLLAHDDDVDDELTYAFVDGADVALGHFSISTDGQITSNAGIDFEVKYEYVLSVIVTDSTGNSDTAEVTITVLDVNEEPSIVVDQVFNVKERDPQGTVATDSIETTDPEMNNGVDQHLTFAIFSGNDEGHWCIDSITSKITLCIGGLDYEAKTEFDLEIQITDDGVPSKSSRAFIKIEVENQNDLPYFDPIDNDDAAWTIPENLDAGTAVGIAFTGNDPDPDDDPSTLRFTLDEGNDYFTIDSTTGQLTVVDGAVLDYETTTKLPITVSIVDSHDETTSVSLEIKLEDTNEAPVIEDQTLFVPERSLINTKLDIKIQASDIDGDSITLSMVDPSEANNVFAVGQAGTVTVVIDNVDLLTYPIQYTFTAKVTDEFGLDDTALITVKTSDANIPPTIESQPFQLYENTENDTLVGQLIGRDIDVEDAHLSDYRIKDNDGTFRIEQETGKIFVDDNTKLDYEMYPSIIFMGGVCDRMEKCVYSDMTVTIMNVNEQPILETFSGSVLENFSKGKVFDVFASDVDNDDGITYTWKPKFADEDPFSLNSSTGQVDLVGEIDYETLLQMYTYTLTAADNYGLKDVVENFVVSIIDENDPPTFDEDSYSFNITENSKSGTILGSVSFSDPDLKHNENEHISLAISEGNHRSCFKINNEGEISVNEESIDFEWKKNFVLKIRGTDSGNLSAFTTVNIEIQDLEDVRITQIRTSMSSSRRLLTSTTDDEETGADETTFDSAQDPPVTFATSGGEKIEIIGSDFGDIDDLNTIVKVRYGTAFDPSEFECTDAEVVKSYGSGNNMVTCLTSAGAGADKFKSDDGTSHEGFHWIVGIQKGEDLHMSEATKKPAAYRGPTVESIEGIEELSTSGGDPIVINGSDFGPVGTPVSLSFSPSSEGDEEEEFFGKSCVVTIDHVQITCTSPPATGTDLVWAISVFDWTSPALTVPGKGFAPPAITSTKLGLVPSSTPETPEDYGMVTNGNEKIRIEGTNFAIMDEDSENEALFSSIYYGPLVDGKVEKKYEAIDCVSSCDTKFLCYVECNTVPGSGIDYYFVVVVGNQESEPSTFTESYRRPKLLGISGPGRDLAKTTGGEQVVLIGTNFGVPGNENVSVTYGGENADLYIAEECVVHDHSTIRCDTAVGIGGNHSWKMVVDEQESLVLNAGTSYGAPVVISYENPDTGSKDISNMKTEGGETVIISGFNFGPMGTELEITYSKSVGGTVFNARNCRVTKAHVTIECTTEAGSGRQLFWNIKIGEQNSTSPSTGYGQPEIHDIVVGGVSGGEANADSDTFMIHGKNFKPFGSKYSQKVSYGPSGDEYVLNDDDCKEIENVDPDSDYELLECKTKPTVGTNLKVVVKVDDQYSILIRDSEMQNPYLNFKGPEIIGMDETSGDSQGRDRVTIFGKNFGVDDARARYAVIFEDERLAAIDSGKTEYNGENVDYVTFLTPSGCGMNKQVTLVTGYSVGIGEGRDVEVGTYDYNPPELIDTIIEDEGSYTRVVLYGKSLCSSGELLIDKFSPTGSFSDTIKTTDVKLWTDERVEFLFIGNNAYVKLQAADKRQSEPIQFAEYSPKMDAQTSDGVATLYGQYRTDGSEILTLKGTHFGTEDVSVKINGKECVLIKEPYKDGTKDVIECQLPELQGEKAEVIVYHASVRSTTVFMLLYPPTLDKLEYCTFDKFTNKSTGGSASCSEVVECVYEAGILGYNCPIDTEGGYVHAVGDNLGYAPEVKISNILGVATSEIDDRTHKSIWFKAGESDNNSEVTINVGDHLAPRIVFTMNNPTVTSIEPERIYTEGGEITIRGNNFGIADGFADRNTVEVNNVPCVYKSSSHHEIVCTAPSGAGINNDVEVRVGGRSNNYFIEQKLKYHIPDVLTIAPSNGPTEGGQTITIGGRSFGADKSTGEIKLVNSNTEYGNVEIPAENIISWDHSLIQFTLPEGQGGHLNVEVTTEYQVSESTVEFGYDPPTITDLKPGMASTDGGDVLLLLGSSFGTKHAVITLDDIPITQIVNQTHTEIQFKMLQGIGTDLELKLSSAGQEATNSIMYSYLPPEVTKIHTTDMASVGAPIEFEGLNFGSEQTDATIIIGGLECHNATWQLTAFYDKRPHLRCISEPDTVGDKNLTLTVATQTQDQDDILTYICPSGHYGQSSEHLLALYGFEDMSAEYCAACPVGGSCAGGLGLKAEPVANAGFWLSLLDESEGFCPSRHDRPSCPVPVRCKPEDSCLGGNECKYGYVNERCKDCQTGDDPYYRKNSECVRCPSNHLMIILLFVLAAVAVCVIGYLLNKKNVHFAFFSIGVDYFQILAMFARAKVEWPSTIDDIFQWFSSFNFNLEIAAPECSIPDVGFEEKFMMTQALPAAACALFALLHLINYIRTRVILKNKMTSQAGVLTSTALVMFYYLYLMLTRSALDLFNCNKLDPDDGYEYLDAVMERCNVSGGMHLRLLPYAIISFIVYSAGYPLLLAYIIYKKRHEIMEDQLLRAKNLGNSKLTNPRAYVCRNRFHKMYYHFKPQYYYWILLVIARKFMIAFTSLMFRDNPSFQLSVALLVVFASYVIQMRYQPYMSPAEFEKVYQDWSINKAMVQGNTIAKEIVGNVQMILAQPKRRQGIHGFERQDNWASKGLIGRHIINYNSVEAVLLCCAFLIALSGIMFSSNYLDSEYYQVQRDTLTWCVLLIIVFSIGYFIFVFAVEILTTLNPKFGLRKQRKRIKRSDSFYGAKSVAEPSNEVAVRNHKVDNYDVNPMFMNERNKIDDGSSVANSDLAYHTQLWTSNNLPNKGEWQLLRMQFLTMQKSVSELQGSTIKLKKELAEAQTQMRVGGSLSNQISKRRIKKTHAPRGVGSADPVSTMRKPKNLWRTATNAEGRTYYYNVQTKERTYSKPTDIFF